MTDRLSRVAHIGDYFFRRVDEGVVLDVVPAADWWQFTDYPQGKYGWTYPQFHEETDTIVPPISIPICPDLIAYQTAALDMQELEQYLHTILWFCSRYITLATAGTEMTVLEVQQQLESELYDDAPHALDLFSRIQLSVLDA